MANSVTQYVCGVTAASLAENHLAMLASMPRRLASMLSWGMDAGVNRLSGLIALCGGWLLWVTSVPWVRRRLFNLFYGCHILGATVFMLFAFMHRKDVATWVMPGKRSIPLHRKHNRSCQRHTGNRSQSSSCCDMFCS